MPSIISFSVQTASLCLRQKFDSEKTINPYVFSDKTEESRRGPFPSRLALVWTPSLFPPCAPLCHVSRRDGQRCADLSVNAFVTLSAPPKFKKCLELSSMHWKRSSLPNPFKTADWCSCVWGETNPKSARWEAAPLSLSSFPALCPLTPLLSPRKCSSALNLRVNTVVMEGGEDKRALTLPPAGRAAEGWGGGGGRNWRVGFGDKSGSLAANRVRKTSSFCLCLPLLDEWVTSWGFVGV